MVRTFEDKPATRERVPLLIGLMGPSGGGKTFSALRLASGIRKVAGGDVFMVDTEARRGLHYAENFKFRHLPLGPPFGPLDYLAAIQHCVDKGAVTIIVDSMSHEHEGPGGVLEMHDSETARLSKQWKVSADKASMAGWTKPKQERRRLINTMLQFPVNFILCFRAKQKLKIERGKDPRPLGFMPIAGEEYIYEMGMNCLLMPGARGVPTWDSEEIGERQMVKLPEWARGMVSEPKALDEELGTQLATWASGVKVRTLDEILGSLSTCQDSATLGTCKTEARIALKGAGPADVERLRAAIETAAARVNAADPPAQNGAAAQEEDPFDDLEALRQAVRERLATLSDAELEGLDLRGLDSWARDRLMVCYRHLARLESARA